MLSVSLIIPTYNRHNDLKRTLKSIISQSFLPSEIFIVVGPEDEASQKICDSFLKDLPMLKQYNSEIPSVITALNIGILNATSEVISLTDDDVELPKNWLFNISNYFYLNKEVGVYGGPDKIQKINEVRAFLEKPKSKVGLFTLWGMIGNHHCGIIDSPAYVDVIKGVNLSLRNSALKTKEIDPYLISNGAETCWEIDLCLNIKKEGFKVVYDNDNFLIHYPGVRVGDDNRDDLFSKAINFRVKNLAYVYAKFRPLSEILIYLILDFLIGSWRQPGIFRLPFCFSKYGFRVLVLPFKRFKYIHMGLKNGFLVRDIH